MALTKMSSIYKAYRTSEHSDERNDCVVRALTVVTNRDYSEVYQVLEANGRTKDKGTYRPTIVKAVKHFGGKEIGVRGMSLSDLEYPTVAQFIRSHPIGRFMCTRNGHAFAIVDGVVHDWQRGTGSRTRIYFAAEF